MVELTQNKSLELKKHVGLIHSTNRLSLLERKIANALLYNAYDDLLMQNEHVVYIPSLCALIGYDSNDHKTIKKSLISLLSTVLEWDLIDQNKAEGQNIWVASTMLADAKIDGPVCTYSYSNRMRELCHYPEFYGRLNIHVLSKFKSTYGLALYENCIRYQNIAQTPWLNLLTYRKLMGVQDGKYEIFRDFNRRVIKPAVIEVNKYSPICVKPQFKKRGRAVESIQFLITKREQTTTTNLNSGADENTVGLLEKEYGFSAKQAENTLKKYEESYVLEKMAIIESSSSYQNGKIKNLAKYLEKALEENYQPPKSSKDNSVNLLLRREKEEKSRKVSEESMREYRNYQDRGFVDILFRLPDKDRASIEKAFSNYISNTLYSGLFLTQGLENILVRDRFGDFSRKNHQEWLPSLFSFDEFCEQQKECV